MRVFILFLQIISHLRLILSLVASSGDDQQYVHIVDADLSDSFERIKNVPVKKFEFLYDSVPGRVQIGVLGSDAQRYIPEAVDVIETLSFPSKEKGKDPTVLKNFLSVDKTVIFMHGIAALKELLNRYDEVDGKLEVSKKLQEMNSASFEELQSKLSSEVQKQAIERERVLKLEKEAFDKELEADLAKATNERSLMEKKLADEKALLELQAEVAREKMRREEEFAILDMQERIKMEKDLADRKEQIRREASEKIQKQKQILEEDFIKQKLEFEKEKIRAEVELKAQQERENEDLNIRKLKVQAELESEQIISTVTVLFDEIGKVIFGILSQPQKLAALCGLVLAFIFSYYGVKEFIFFVRSLVQSYIGKPSLVRETSMKWHFLPASISDWLFPEDFQKSFSEIQKHFSDVILGADDRERVIQLALTTRNTKNTKAPYRHVLLHGPPGTGKTLIARKLAESSGMDYAIMSGGDVGPLGEDAVSQLHRLFKWAQKSRKGLLLFIDEAEAFLSARSGNNLEDAPMRHALNALLYQTGTPSRTFMLILATNRPQELDAAVLDRIDVSLQIDLPGVDQRKDMIELYMRIHLLSLTEKVISKKLSFFQIPEEKFIISEDCYSEKTYTEIATEISGFSGREISKLFIALRYALSVNLEKELNIDTMKSIVAEKVVEHSRKVSYIKVEDKLGAHGGGRKSHEINTPPRYSLNSPIANSERQFNELEAKLARRRNMNGESIPGIVVLSAASGHSNAAAGNSL